MPSFSSTSAARMPSQVEASLISTRSRPMPCVFVQRDEFAALGDRKPSVSNDRRASTSVDTRPGTIFRISVPNAISNWSMICADRLRRVRLDGLFEQRLVVVFLHGLQDQRRIGGRVLRLVLGELLEVAGIGHDGGVLLELVECGCHVRAFRARARRGSGEMRIAAGLKRNQIRRPRVTLQRCPSSCWGILTESAAGCFYSMADRLMQC